MDHSVSWVANGIPKEIRVGIGVITYNRRELLKYTLDELLRYTSCACQWVVADDGSTDGSADMVRFRFPGMAVIAGNNRGVTWNRNRAMWWLHNVQRCDVSILVEDDTSPMQACWEADWIAAARLHGHVNLAGEWFSGGFVRGSGTVTDPIVSMGVSGQISAFSRDAIDHVGFYDGRYRGYGMGHVEHTCRMIRAGYGGEVVKGAAGEFDEWQLRKNGAVLPSGLPEVLFHLLKSPIEVVDAGSSRLTDPGAEDRNIRNFAKTVHDQVYRTPWSSDGQMLEFRAEIAASRAGVEQSFYSAQSGQLHEQP